MIKCPRCSGSVVSNECISCGYVVSNSSELHKFLLQNQKEILDDFNIFGVVHTCKKWGIGKSALYNLPAVRRQLDKQKIKSVAARDPSGFLLALNEVLSSNSKIQKVKDAFKE